MLELWVKANTFADEHGGPVKSDTVDIFDERSTDLEAATKGFHTAYLKYVKETLGDFAKLRS